MPREAPEPESLSDQLELWLSEESPTLGSLIELLGAKSFAALFVVLMAVPALPLPTGGVTLLMEAVAMLLALELIAGREEVWLPRRWRRLRVAEPGGRGRRFAEGLVHRVRWLEARARPRQERPVERRPARLLFGVTVFVFALASSLAPPFSGLDTIPALGAVLLSLGVVLGDRRLIAAGLAIGAVGVLIVVFVAGLVIDAVGDLL